MANNEDRGNDRAGQGQASAQQRSWGRLWRFGERVYDIDQNGQGCY